MIRSIIVDDEQKNRESLQMMIAEYCSDIVVTHMAGSVREAKMMIDEHQPHLVFLDVEMPPLNAFDLLKSFKEINFEIIFVTAFNYYAIEAIKFSALYYILKPVKIEELQEAVERARHKIISKNPTTKEQIDIALQEPNHLTRIAINSQNQSHLLELESISYIASENVYSKFYLENGKTVLSSKPIIEYENLLTKYNFYRVHKSFLVNIKKVIKVIKGDNLGVVLANEIHIPVAHRRRDEFFRIMDKN